jgi:hypothetical protein
MIQILILVQVFINFYYKVNKPWTILHNKNIQGLHVAKGTYGAERVNFEFVRATTLTDDLMCIFYYSYLTCSFYKRKAETTRTSHHRPLTIRFNSERVKIVIIL